MIALFSIVTLIIGVFLFLFYFCFLLFGNANLSKDKKNSLLNSYPYQFYMSFSLRFRVFLYGMFGLMILANVVGQCLVLLVYNTVYMNILAVIFPLSIVCLAVSNVLSLDHYKGHLFFASAGFLIFGSACLMLSIASIIPESTIYGTVISLPVVILIGILGGLILVGLLNPKIMDWAKMERAEDNGKVFYVRPKVNFLAFHEWLCLFFMEAVSVLLMIQLFLSGVLNA